MGWLRWLATGLFMLYLAVFPGSTLVVALDRVPAGGDWMGAALLLGQGAAVLCWMLGHHGRGGALAALLVALLAWGVEHVGVRTGLPFGRYSYTAQLQPQLLGGVPLPIVAAWLMAAMGAWQLAGWRGRPTVQRVPLAATLVLLLDLQIETVATLVNRYWVWLDSGPYYGVPTANFIAWWLVGLGAGLICSSALDSPTQGIELAKKEPQSAVGRPMRNDRSQPFAPHASLWRHWWLRVQANIPAWLYLLSTLMFTVVNLARGYTLAGLVGAAVLGLAGGVLLKKRSESV